MKLALLLSIALANNQDVIVPPAGTPAPPPALKRSTPAPEYSAKCQAISRNGQLNRLSAEVTNSGGRAGKVVATTAGLSEFRGLPFLTTSEATTDWADGWTQDDDLMFHVGGQTLAVRLTVNENTSAGRIDIVNMRGAFGVPLHAGMCRVRFR